eukprot:2042781-Rhodomonas_salina.1
MEEAMWGVLGGALSRALLTPLPVPASVSHGACLEGREGGRGAGVRLCVPRPGGWGGCRWAATPSATPSATRTCHVCWAAGRAPCALPPSVCTRSAREGERQCGTRRSAGTTKACLGTDCLGSSGYDGLLAGATRLAERGGRVGGCHCARCSCRTGSSSTAAAGHTALASRGVISCRDEVGAARSGYGADVRHVTGCGRVGEDDGRTDRDIIGH